MTERSDRAAAIAFVVIVACLVGAVIIMLFSESQDVRSTLAGFVGGVIAVLAVGVARWISTGTKS